MHKQFENIEVAVRARPLNNFETTKHAEAAWEIKKGGMQSNRCKQRSLNRPGDQRMGEVAAEAPEKTIQLKNKYRFGFDCGEKGAAKRATRTSGISCRASNQPRSKSAVNMAQHPPGAQRSMMQQQSGIGKGTKAKLPQNTLEAIGDQAVTDCTQNQPAVLTARPSASAVHPSNHQTINGFRTQHNTPYYTPTPRYSRGDSAMENTPHQPKDVTEFSLYPTEAPGVGISSILPSSGAKTGRQGNLTNRGNGAGKHSLRTKSLTATTQKKSTIKILRLNSLTAKKVERNSKSALGFMTTSKNLLTTQTQGNELPHRGTNACIATAANKQQLQHKFDYDRVYGERDTNRDVYEQTVKKVALAALEGVNGTVFVYGQTGTGKTYTMMGHQRSANNDGAQHGAKVRQPSTDANGRTVSARTRNLHETYENSGVLIFAMQDLFNKMSELEITQRSMNNIVQFQIKLSYIEIYNEMIHDLLASDRQSISEQVLSIHEGKDKEFFVKGAREVGVTSIHEVLDLIKIGERNRHYAETFLNHCSSRSHTLFRLHVTSFQRSQNAKDNRCLQSNSFLNFVDLAGSEKISNYFGPGHANNSQAEFNQSIRLKEGLSINKSLFYLTQVIHMLSQKSSKHVPYRNSTLTKILRSSLSGNSRTSVIICITPASSQIEQTISSLKFGQKAMKVQQSARVQINEIKSNAIKNRHNLNYNAGGVEQRVLQEIVEEYEGRIKGLEAQINDNSQIQQLRDQVASLQHERDKLMLALELNCDRTFFTKQLYMKQKLGFQTMSLRIAGDVAIQTKPMAELSIEQLMDERDQTQQECLVISKSCQLTANKQSQENKNLKAENMELKEECERLEQSYYEIMDQFSKMSSIQQELIDISNKHNKDQGELINLEKMTDREIQKMDNQLKQKIFQIKEEKEKRQRQKKMNDSLGRSSSGKIKNFVRPYNLQLSMTPLTQRSHRSTPPRKSQRLNSGRQNSSQYIEQTIPVPAAQNSGRDGREYLDLPEQDETFRKNLNGTFGQKKSKKINETIGGITIDKSLYAQDHSKTQHNTSIKRYVNTWSSERRRYELKDTPREQDVLRESMPPAEQPEQPANAPEPLKLSRKSAEPAQPVVFNQVHNVHQYFQQLQAHPQFDVIKEEVHNENNVSSFDNLSNSLGFDLSAPIMPGHSGAPSLAAFSAGNINVNLNEHHHQDGQWTSWHHSLAAGTNQLHSCTNISAEEQDVRYLNTAQNSQKKSRIVANESHFIRAPSNAETPKRQVLAVQPQMNPSKRPRRHPFDELQQLSSDQPFQDLELRFQNCNTFENSLEKFSDIGQTGIEQQNLSYGGQRHTKDENMTNLVNEELMMEFQLEQLLEQQITLNENYHGVPTSSLGTKKHSSGRLSQPVDEINHYTPQESAPAPEEKNIEVDVLHMSDSLDLGSGVMSEAKAEQYEPYCSNDNERNGYGNMQDEKENVYDEVHQLHEDRIMPYSAATISSSLQQQLPNFSFKNSPGTKGVEDGASGGICSLIKSMSRSQLKNTNSQSMSQPQNRKEIAARASNPHVSFQQSGNSSKMSTATKFESKFESKKASLASERQMKAKENQRYECKPQVTPTKTKKKTPIKSPIKTSRASSKLPKSSVIAAKSPRRGGQSTMKSKLSRQPSGLLRKADSSCREASQKANMITSREAGEEVESTPAHRKVSPGPTPGHSQRSNQFLSQQYYTQPNSRTSCSVNQTSTSNTHGNASDFSSRQRESSRRTPSRRQLSSTSTISKEAAEVAPRATTPTSQVDVQQQAYSYAATSTKAMAEAQEAPSAGSRRRSRTKSMYLDLRSEAKKHDDYQKQLECSEINVGFFDHGFEQAAFEGDVDQFQTPRVLDQDGIRMYSKPESADVDHQTNQAYMYMISNAKPDRQVAPEESSDIQTPYGLIEVNDGELSDNTHSQKGYRQQQFGELIQQSMGKMGARTKTPSNVGHDDQQQFFREDEGATADIFEDIVHEGSAHNTNHIHELKSRAAEDTASGQPVQVLEQIEDHHLMTESRSRDGSYAHGTSGISISRSQNQSHKESKTRSFTPDLTKERQELEETNKKLQEHQNQYRKYYHEVLDDSQLHDDVEASQNSAQRPFDYESHKKKELQSPNLKSSLSESQDQEESESLSNPLTNALYENCQKRLDSRTGSLVSHSTSQGLTTADRGGQSLNLCRNFATDFSSNPNRQSSEFDHRSHNLQDLQPVLCLSRESEPKPSSRNSNLRTPEDQASSYNGMPAYQALNQRISQINSQIEPNWQQTSQASLEKLQAEYEKIKQKRNRIIQDLELDSAASRVCTSPYRSQHKSKPTTSPQKLSYVGTKKSSALLKDTKKQLKLKSFEPLARRSSHTKEVSRLSAAGSTTSKTSSIKQTTGHPGAYKTANLTPSGAKTPVLARDASNNSLRPGWLQ